MQKIVLGTLLTVIAAGLGSFVGFMLALPILCAAGETLFDVILYGMPITFGVLGVCVAWAILLRKPTDLKYVSNPKACLSCGYDLRGNQTGRCPECNASIPAEQRRFIQLS